MGAIEGLDYNYSRSVSDSYAPADYQQYNSNLRSEQCRNENFIDSVVAPAFEDHLPQPSSFAGKVLNHLSGFYDFMGSVRSDLCNSGRISAESAKNFLNFGARSLSTIAIGQGTFILGGLALAASGPVALAGVAGLGALGLLIGPPIAEKAVDKIWDFTANLFSRTGSWIEENRGRNLLD